MVLSGDAQKYYHRKRAFAKGPDTEARRARENVLTVIAKVTAVAFLQFLTLCGMISLRIISPTQPLPYTTT